MDSSTLHSRERWKQASRRVVFLLTVALVTWALSALYTLGVNPEVILFREMLQTKKAWAARVSAAHGAKYVIMGGSSAAFAFDAKHLVANHRLPVVNGGLYAAMGPKILALTAFEMLNSGDTLLVALEPGLLTEPLEPTTFGIQFSFATGHPEWVTREALGIDGIPYASALLALRPGAYHLITAIGKRALKLPSYRYSINEVDEAGFLQPSVRMEVSGPPMHGGSLSAPARAYLLAVKEECHRRNIRVAYLLPWAYCPPEARTAFQAHNRQLLKEIAECLPVVRDERLGAYEEQRHFADTPWHLVGEGARRRTDALAGALKSWALWTVQELADQPDQK